MSKTIKTGVQVGIVAGVGTVVALVIRDAWRSDRFGFRTLGKRAAKYASSVEIKGVDVHLPGTSPKKQKSQPGSGWFSSGQWDATADIPDYRDEEYEDVE